MSIPLRVFPDIPALASVLAGELAGFISKTVEQRGQCAIALAGGNSPRAVYASLAKQSGVPWNRVHLFWGDERYVPHDHPLSNYRMANESLISQIKIPAENVHAVPTQLATSADAAAQYESTLKEFFKSGPAFDLILLGMGADGHTASLFPATPGLDEKSRWTIPVTASIEPPLRISLTMPVLLQANAVYFIITGKDKAATLHQALEEPGAGNRFPAAKVFESVPSRITCWMDRAAAANLSSQLL